VGEKAPSDPLLSPASPSSQESERASQIFIVSDGTGETAADAARAAMLQFQARWNVRTFSDVRSVSQARSVAQEAAREGALIVFTIVSKECASAMREYAAQEGIPAVDLLGPLISNIAEHLQAEPRDEPGLLHGFSDDYFRRIEAVEFAVRHDDGAHLHTLYKADLVLTGVSRTSKTPLSMHLAQRGFKTGNVPLVPGIDPPRELLEFDSRRVFGLLVDVERLVTIRRARARNLGTSPHLHYADFDSVSQELDRARRLFRTRGWRIVDISGRAVEENASRLLELVEADRRS